MSMIIPGLVSITFRKKTPDEILTLLERAGVGAVEWGGDVHVPPDSLPTAVRVGHETRERGIAVASYGSYFRLGAPMDDFMKNAEACARLGAPVLRIWAGSKGSVDTSPGERAALVEALMACGARAREHGITLGLEYHGGTLTDCRGSVIQLMRETHAAREDVLFYWQPRWDWPEAERLASLEDVRPRLAHVHAFTWSHGEGPPKRLPIESGADMWRPLLRSLSDRTRYALIEFVEGEADEAFLRDARALKDWCAQGAGAPQ